MAAIVILELDEVVAKNTAKTALADIRRPEHRDLEAPWLHAKESDWFRTAEKRGYEALF